MSVKLLVQMSVSGVVSAVSAFGCAQRTVYVDRPVPVYQPVQVAPAPVQGQYQGQPPAGTEVVVEPAPLPPPQQEVVIVSPGPDYIWVPGAYEWYGHGYVWVGGHWVRPAHRGAVWIGGGWHRGPRGYVWAHGHWR